MSDPTPSNSLSRRCGFVGMYDIPCGLNAGHEGAHRIYGPHTRLSKTTPTGTSNPLVPYDMGPRGEWYQRKDVDALLLSIAETAASLRERIAALDPYTAHGATESGLAFADISTEHVRAFQDKVLDIIDDYSDEGSR